MIIVSSRSSRGRSEDRVEHGRRAGTLRVPGTMRRRPSTRSVQALARRCEHRVAVHTDPEIQVPTAQSLGQAQLAHASASTHLFGPATMRQFGRVLLIARAHAVERLSRISMMRVKGCEHHEPPN
jgi:hypothetical protein